MLILSLFPGTLIILFDKPELLHTVNVGWAHFYRARFYVEIAHHIGLINPTLFDGDTFHVCGCVVANATPNAIGPSVGQTYQVQLS